MSRKNLKTQSISKEFFLSRIAESAKPARLPKVLVTDTKDICDFQDLPDFSSTTSCDNEAFFAPHLLKFRGFGKVQVFILGTIQHISECMWSAAIACVQRCHLTSLKATAAAHMLCR
jgi:hypothetical protein